MFCLIFIYYRMYMSFVFNISIIGYHGLLYNMLYGLRVIGISGSLIWSKTLMKLIFNPYDEYR